MIRRQCGKDGCEKTLEGRHPSALYCCRAHKEQQSDKRSRQRYPEKRAARQRASNKASNRTGPLRERTPLGALLRGNLSLERVIAPKPPHCQKKTKTTIYEGIYACNKCGVCFLAFNGQGFSKGPRCRECRTTHQASEHLRWREKKCCRCDFVPEDICQLEVDHIDGNPRNNDPFNLQTLCATCHRLKHNAPHIFRNRPAHAPRLLITHRVPEVVVGKWGHARSSEDGQLALAGG